MYVDLEWAKLLWLVRLRWLAIGLFFFITVPAYLMSLLDQTTITVYIGVLSILFMFNFFTQIVFVEKQRRVGPLFIGFQFAFDLLIFTILILISGGHKNPFIILLLLNASLGALLIRGRYSWSFLMLCHALLLIIQLNYLDSTRERLTQISLNFIFASHILVFCFWFVMRLFGRYFENHFEIKEQRRLVSEKKDRLQALGALAAGFSHEFASPLNAAKLRLDRLQRLLTSFQLPADILENLSEALDSIQACESVIHQMNSSQLDIRDYNLKKIEMSSFLQDIIKTWMADYPMSKIILNSQKVSLKVSPINLTQVVLNLLDNAYEAAGDKTISVYFDNQNGQAVLKIEDEGIGFSSVVLRRQGEPFVTTKDNGTGLGLYVSEIFVQSLGGEMHLKNKIGGGAQVLLTWPIQIHHDFNQESTEFV